MTSPPTDVVLGWRRADRTLLDAVPASADLVSHPRPRVHTREVLADNVIQPYAHVWNVTLAQWLDELSAELFDRRGTVANGHSWFVVRQETSFRGETMLGDSIVAATWISSIDRARATQEALLLRRGDGAVLLQSTSTWTLVDLATRRPVRVTPALRARLE